MIIGFVIAGLVLAAILTMITPLYSYAFSLQLPIDCKLGENCYIQNYVDLDTGKDWRDYRCGFLSYDGHKGTDFRLINVAQMKRGVNVLASADGTVKGIRDGMDDINFKNSTPAAVANRECGNGVLILHVGGYKTQYCHMKKGSVAVKAGDYVKTGAVLGQVGLSGQTEFPHVHLQVTDSKDQIIDPFSGPMLNSKCGGFGQSLWDKSVVEKLAYQDTSLLNMAFAPVVPESDKMRDDPEATGRVDANSDLMAMWVDIMGVKKGDVLFMMIKGPDGKQLVYHSATFDKNLAAYFQTVGKKRTEDKWADGIYTGILTLRRGEDADAPVALTKEIQLVIGDPSKDDEGAPAPDEPTPKTTFVP